MMCFDVTNRDSFVHVERWISDVKEYAGQHVMILLCGNKVDMMDKREVSFSEAKVRSCVCSQTVELTAM